MSWQSATTAGKPPRGRPSNYENNSQALIGIEPLWPLNQSTNNRQKQIPPLVDWNRHASSGRRRLRMIRCGRWTRCNPATRQGKALREQTPRESHATWTPATDRADPVATVLASNVGREESLVPLRMGRMAASPFAFLRGACAVMAGDLAQTPISGLQVMIDGDAHINNFGLYGTPQRDVVIDINDFDEATIGPWEWDLKRLVASVNVAGRENGLDAEERHSAVMRCVSGYSLNAQRLMNLGILETWSLFAYAELERHEAALKRSGNSDRQQVPGGRQEGAGESPADAQRNAAREGRSAASRRRLAIRRRPADPDEPRRGHAAEGHCVADRVCRDAPAGIPVHAESLLGRGCVSPRGRRRQRRDASVPRAAVRQRR